MTKSISIAIPVHNGLPHIKTLLESVFAQTLLPDEVIVVENKSTDDTLDYLKSVHHPLLRVVVQDRFVSAPENWSRSAQETRGDLVKLICADDVLQPTALERQRDVFLKNSGLVLVAGRRSIIDEDDNIIIRSRGLAGLRGLVSRTDVIRAATLTGTNVVGEVGGVLFNGDALRAALPWPDSYGYVTDLVQYERILRRGGAYFLEDTVASFRISPQAWSSRIQRKQSADFDRLVTEWIADGLELSGYEQRRSRIASRINQVARRVLYLYLSLRQRIRSLTN